MKTPLSPTGSDAPTGALVPAPAPAPSPPAPRRADLSAALAELVAAVTTAVGPERAVTVELTLEIGGRGMAGGGPPVNPDGEPMNAGNDQGTMRYTNQTGRYVWVYVAYASPPPLTVTTSLPAPAMFQINLAQAHINGVAFNPADLGGVTGLAYRVPDQGTIAFAWTPANPPGLWPKFWWAPA